MNKDKQASGPPPATPVKRPASAPGRGGRKVAAPAGPADPDGRDARIRISAYALYEARGRVDGHALEDWLQAEARVDDDAAVSVAADAPARPAPKGAKPRARPPRT